MIEKSPLVDPPDSITTKNAAVGHDGKCNRCKIWFGNAMHCRECGVHRDRIVQRIRRRKIGGKRGRNSGRVGTSK